MAQNYTVRQGDYIAKIAKAFGFSDWRVIWNDPNNSDLKQQRQNPNVLFPGDSVFIPDRVERHEPAGTEQKHSFVKKSSGLKLRMTLLNQYDQPIANATCTLALGSRSQPVTTDGDGKISEDIEPGTQDGILMIRDAASPFNDIPITFKIGDLDPVEQVSGQVARLNNLGYFAGDLSQPDPDAFQSAVEEFQCDNSLTVDGKCGPLTQSKLKQVHGC